MADTARRFVILSARRSGSNLLCTLIDSHPDALCHHELFNPRGIFTALDLRDTATPLHDIATRERDPVAYLAQVWRCNANVSALGQRVLPR